MSAPARLDPLASAIFLQHRLFGLAHHRGPDRESLTDFVVRRNAPLGALLFAAPHFGVPITIPPELTFFYNTADWPDDAPPAGWVADAIVPPPDAMRSRPGDWTLQGSDGGGLSRLARGTLWTLHHHGYRRALEFVIDSICSGVVVHSGVAIEWLTSLLGVRRRVASDADIFRQFARRVPGSPAEWRSFDIDRPALLSAAPCRTPTDDLDWLQAATLSRIAAARAAGNADEWLSRFLETSKLCRVISESFQAMGLDEDLAYGAFVAQVEEIKADGGMFMLWHFNNFADTDRASVPWSPATAMARIAQARGEEWLEQIMEERVLVPDALLDLYFENPVQFDEALRDPWLVPSAAIRMAFAEINQQGSEYPFMPVGVGLLPISIEMLRAETERADVEMETEDLEDLLAVLRRGFESRTRDIAIGDIDLEDSEFIGFVTVPRALVQRLTARTGAEGFALEKWILRIYYAICADFARDSLIALISGEPSHFASLEEFVAAFPNLSLGRHERAIELDQQGDAEAAWTEIADAILLQPDNELIWHSAAVILDRLGTSAEAMVARFMAQCLTDRREAGG